REIAGIIVSSTPARHIVRATPTRSQLQYCGKDLTIRMIVLQFEAFLIESGKQTTTRGTVSYIPRLSRMNTSFLRRSLGGPPAPSCVERPLALLARFRHSAVLTVKLPNLP